MPKLKVSNVRIRYADLRLDEAGPFSRVHCSADVTKMVARKMGWEDFIYDGDGWRGGFGSVSLDGELRATSIEMKHQNTGATLELTADDVSDFSLNRKKEEDGEGTRMELRFIVRSRQKGALAKVERYCELNREGAQLLINHEKQADLFDQNEEETEEAEQITEAEPAGPTLASASGFRRRSQKVAEEQTQ